MSANRFRFLGEEHSLASHGWDDPGLDKLWRYNLHYFDELTAGDDIVRSAWRPALLDRWMRENPPGTGTGWEPYPTSLRIVNWVKWALAGNELSSDCVHSLSVQVRWLRQRLEAHLLGNHLFANAKALTFAGFFFRGPEADAWLEEGLRLLSREVPEQILADGGQFERSPMYHALALEDMLDITNVIAAYPNVIPPHFRMIVAGWRDRIDDMRRWMLAMSHPDGEIGFFNDAAMGIAPRPGILEEYAARLGFITDVAPHSTITALEPSGYVRVATNEVVALLDVAPIGPDYLPAHAHADTLSFELSLFGQRLLVNSGTSRYGGGPERLRERGTAAHNTVLVDGKDSSEVWGGFRVARRARPIGLVVEGGESVVVQCAHDGYHRLLGAPTHRRRWIFAGRTITVEDHVAGSFSHAEARFHLHPSLIVGHPVLGRNGETTVSLEFPEGHRVQFIVQCGGLGIESTTWHPEFGQSVANRCLVVLLNEGLGRVHIKWNHAP